MVHQRRFERGLAKAKSRWGAARLHVRDVPADVLGNLRRLQLPHGLYSFQRALIADPVGELVVISATQIGKTTACALWLLARAWCQPGTLNWWAAPTYKQTDIGFNRLVRFAKSANVYRSHNIAKRLLYLTNGSIVEARSWEREETLPGSTVHNMVIDEAGELSHSARAQFAARRSATLGPVRLIGNPGVTGSAFWEVCQQAIEREQRDGSARFLRWTWRDRVRELPRSARGAYIRFIRQQRHDIPNAEFRRLYEAEWAVPESAVFGSIVDSMCRLDPDATPHPGHRYIVGWDIGLEEDNTVGAPLCLQCFTIQEMIVARPGDPNALKRLIADTCRHYNGATGVIETNGPGGPIFHEVAELYPNVQKWWTDTTSKRDAVFEVHRRGKSAQLTIPNDEGTLGEFRVFRSHRNPKSGLWSFEAPRGSKDDRVMAVLIAVGSATSGAAAFIEMIKQQLEETKKARKAKDTDGPPSPQRRRA